MSDFWVWFLNFELSYDWATLLLRLSCGCALLPYGIKKFCERHGTNHFPAVLFLSSRASYYTAMCIETFASCFVILGFLTRLAAIAGICNMAIAAKVSKGPYFTTPASSFLLMFAAIFMLGPGGFSLDYILFRY